MLTTPEFLTGRVGALETPVFRLGLSATYRPGERTIRTALDEGVNYLFAFGMDTQMNSVIRSLGARREKVLIATGGYNCLVWHPPLRKSLENALRRLRTDYIDVFHYLGLLKPTHFPPRVQDELAALRADGRVRAIAVSCHDRKFAGWLAEQGIVDVVMIRYNAAHRGAETEIFPFVAAHGTGVVSYTATRWRRLLVRPRGWPREQAAASAGQCYRFVLSNPKVDVVLTAPSNERQFAENLREVRRGPLPEDEMEFMRRFGDEVHARAGWFMGS